jgi:hypothetical protein
LYRCRGTVVVKPHQAQDIVAQKRIVLERLRRLEERLKRQAAEFACISAKLVDGSVDAATASAWNTAAELLGYSRPVEQIVLSVAETVDAMLHAKFGDEEYWPETHREMAKQRRETHREYLKAAEERKSLPKPSLADADFAAQEARRRDPALLVNIVRRMALSPAAAEVIVEALAAKAGKQYKAMVEDVEAHRLAFGVSYRGGKKDETLKVVAKEHGLSRSTAWRRLRRLPKP